MDLARMLVAHFAREREDGKPPSTHRAAWVAFVLATAARFGEANRARVEDARETKGEVALRGTETVGSLRTVPILPLAREFLAVAKL